MAPTSAADSSVVRIAQARWIVPSENFNDHFEKLGSAISDRRVQLEKLLKDKKGGEKYADHYEYGYSMIPKKDDRRAFLRFPVSLKSHELKFDREKLLA